MSESGSNPKSAFQGADLIHGFYLCLRPERLFAGMNGGAAPSKAQSFFDREH
jgi:hypothetical protein